MHAKHYKVTHSPSSIDIFIEVYHTSWEQASENAFNLRDAISSSTPLNVKYECHTTVAMSGNMEIGALRNTLVTGFKPRHLPSPFGPHHCILMSCEKIGFLQGLVSSQVIVYMTHNLSKIARKTTDGLLLCQSCCGLTFLAGWATWAHQRVHSLSVNPLAGHR